MEEGKVFLFSYLENMPRYREGPSKFSFGHSDTVFYAVMLLVPYSRDLKWKGRLSFTRGEKPRIVGGGDASPELEEGKETNGQVGSTKFPASILQKKGR